LDLTPPGAATSFSDAPKETGRRQAAIWFWSFTWLVQLVMLNMLLAIVMDIYTEVRGKIGEGAQTLWSQALEIERRYRQKQLGARVSLDYIMSYIEPDGFKAKGYDNPQDLENISIEGRSGSREEGAAQRGGDGYLTGSGKPMSDGSLAHSGPRTKKTQLGP